jgi:3-isopropylmalate/(R)-2-methylmalate dehydratase small subunit
MEKFTRHTGIVALLDRKNVDTDQIIPKQFLTRTEKSGYENFLFYNWRFNADGTDNPDFELNNPAFQGATILLAGDNFGCGSSREHAPWALSNYGFRSIISTGFADIFHSNCFKNGILLINVTPRELSSLMDEVRNREGVQFSIDLEQQSLSTPGGNEVRFNIDKTRKDNLLNGFDEIESSLRLSHSILAFEKNQKQNQPWLWS